MFVRVKKRKSVRGPGQTTFNIVLVENYRSGGKVRQRHIKHLATINEYHATLEHVLYRMFNEIETRLGEINRHLDVESIISEVERKLDVNRPTREQAEARVSQLWQELD
ncbi:hypothetical protein [Ornithinibacillus scapharcae]|uniref:hypothetical protein n=1 Tax=Ornithinibacillus scapharcae TaxID=1147159 RepID=UPI000225B2E5|nr:hypothetical protein [Ornithinibacillus scapharcae]